MTISAMRFSGRRKILGWRFVVCLVLFAFTLQSYVVQSHIHDGSQGFGVSAISKTDANAPLHRKSPLDDGTLNCRICQAIAHASAFLTPATLPFLPALAAELAAPLITTCAVVTRVLHDWQSRAPPQH